MWYSFLTNDGTIIFSRASIIHSTHRRKAIRKCWLSEDNAFLSSSCGLNSLVCFYIIYMRGGRAMQDIKKISGKKGAELHVCAQNEIQSQYLSHIFRDELYFWEQILAVTLECIHQNIASNILLLHWEFITFSAIFFISDRSLIGPPVIRLKKKASLTSLATMTAVGSLGALQMMPSW